MKAIYFLYGFVAIMSLFSFSAMGLDKLKAKRGAWRIPEATLFLLAGFGGGIGGTLGMKVFRHKTKHWYFKLCFPLFAVLQLALCVWLGFKAF